VNPGYRAIARVLCAALLLSALGCAGGVERAEHERQFLYPGMTMQEVADQLGEPSQIIQGDPGTETAWIYRYEGGPGAAATVFLVIFFVLVIAALALGGGGGSISGGGGGGGGPPCQIRLRFDPDGRLRDVSPPHPVPGT